MKNKKESKKGVPEKQTDFECPVCLRGELIGYFWLEKKWYRCNNSTCEVDYPEHCLLFHYPDALN
jgi:hypothetical protein